MAVIRLISWNVNGIRGLHRKGLTEWIGTESPDVLCLQETKAAAEQVPEEIRTLPGYSVFFSSGEKKGYSGVAVFTRKQPLAAHSGLGDARFDSDGRILLVEYPEFLLCNIYFPNGKASPERLQYKLAFYEAFLDFTNAQLKAGKQLVVCGDVNTAHQEIDLARPKENSKVSGFLPEEREWIDRFLASGFLDSFRLFQPEGGHYSWWDLKSRARARNVGWRIDYFFISQGLRQQLKSAFIMPEVMGSDHCPVGIELEI